MGRGQAPYPTPLKGFYLKKKVIMCELKGGRPVNGIASELPMQRIGDLYYVFLTMEMNERGYKIKGPHWNALHYYSSGDL